MEESDEDIHEIIIGHRRYMATKVGDVEVTVRIPLHIFEKKDPKALEEFAEELVHKVRAEKRRQGLREKPTHSQI